MNSAFGNKSTAFIGQIGTKTSLILDLGSTQRFSQINLHAVEQEDTIPQAYHGDLGIPKQMLIEGANYEDFSDAITLLDYRNKGISSTGPIIALKIKPIKCRYLQFTPIQKPNNEAFENKAQRIGFAEIEIIADGKNIALNCPITITGLSYGKRNLEALTDGRNLYGKILPLKEWMNELESRGRLESEQKKITAELDRRYTKQRTLLSRMYQLILLLTASIGFIILFNRHLRMQNINAIRRRIAADLHDDLGTNIHAIGLFSDMAKDSLNSSQSEVIDLLNQIREFTKNSDEAIHQCSKTLKSGETFEDVVSEMKKFTTRALADLQHEFILSGDTFINALDSETKTDLFLFFKECLINIIRHAKASKVIIRLKANYYSLELRIVDDGIGFDKKRNMKSPPSLKRRARLLGTVVKTQTPKGGGTEIYINLKTRKFQFINVFKNQSYAS